jgi:hypothetical protein
VGLLRAGIRQALAPPPAAAVPRVAETAISHDREGFSVRRDSKSFAIMEVMNPCSYSGIILGVLRHPEDDLPRVATASNDWELHPRDVAAAPTRSWLRILFSF